MRSVAFIAALACATAAHADGVRESRYGPERERAPTPQESGAPGFSGAAYDGRMLGWSGKREPVAPVIEAPPAQQPWWGRTAPQAAPVYQPQTQPRAQVAYPAQAPAYAPPPARALPRNIYDTPPAAAPSAPAYSAPVQTAYAVPPQAEPMRTPWKEGQVGARTYSVGRQFGMTPDPIPAAGPPRMVLIAPPATAPDDDKPREQDDRDWPAKTDKDGAH